MALSISRLFRPRPRYAVEWNGHVAVLAPGPIPTVDYYLTPHLKNLTHTLFTGEAFDAAALPAGTFVVIARHAAPRWLRALWLARHRWSGIAYLMDDDIPAAWRCRDVPFDYGLWTTGRYLHIRHWLARLCDRVWVSTPELARRYPGAAVLPPWPFRCRRGPAPLGCRRWGYHGTRIHRRELEWLVPVVRAVQHRMPQAVFEVFGDDWVRRLFAGIPRVEVIAPLPWPQYLRRAEGCHLAVGLAPMLPGYFNAARSSTKVFDILRCGAVPVCSARAPYDDSGLQEAGAVLLPDDPGKWADAVTHLLADDDRRMWLYGKIVERWLRGAAGAHIEELIRKDE